MTVPLSALPWTPWALLALPVTLYVGLAAAVARRQAWPGEIKLAVAGTGIVLVSAWMISFSALMAFFLAAYVEVPLNALGPVSVDGEMAVGTIVWIAVGQGGVRLADVTSRGDVFRWLLSPRPYVALLVAAAAALSAIANAAHPFTAANHWPAPWSYAASAVPGVVMFAVIHQLVILFRVLRPEPVGIPTPQPDPEPEPPAPLPPPPSDELSELPVAVPELPAETNGRVPVTLALARREYRRLAKLSPDGHVSGAALGAALSVSAVSGRKWKGKVEGKVVGAPKAADTFRLGVAA